MKRPVIPTEIIIEITGKCKLACDYCTDSRRPHVPLDNIIAILDEASEMGVKGIRITGGEPLLHPALETILNYAKSKNFTILINTAAEEISPSMMKAITRNVEIALVSLQGHSAARNAAYTRSKASFAQKIKNILYLKSHLPALWLGTVITPAMAGSFDKYLSLVTKIKPAAWALLRPISDPNEDLKQMDVAFYRNLTIKIMKARKDGVNVYIANPIPLCIAGDLKVGKEAYFGANLDDGHVRLVYSAQGFYKPSYFITTNLGNTIKTAWANPALKELDRTDYLPALCQKCPVFDTCRGGCRAMSQRSNGTPFGPDPLFDLASAQKALSKPYPETVLR